MIAGTGRRTFAALLLAALFVAALGCSRDEAEAPSDESRELYELSELSSRFVAVRDFLAAQLQLQQAHWTPNQFQAAVRVIDERFAETELAARILGRLDAQRDPRFTTAALEWLRTPETRRVHAGAGVMTEAKVDSAFQDFMMARRKSPPSKTRLALIERYDRAARRSSDSRHSLLLASYGIALMADTLAADDAQAGPDALRKSVEHRNELLAPIFEELCVIELSFAFRELSDADVAAFVAHSESPAVQWYYQALSSAFLETLEEISSSLGAAFVTARAAQPDA